MILNKKFFEVGTASDLVKASKVSTPLGQMVAVVTDEAVCFLEFADGWKLDEQQKQGFVYGSNKVSERLEDELLRYFEGRLKEFSVPLYFLGTEFQQKVWRELLRIPYGGTRSYKELAEAIGEPKAVRAVTRANGANRLPKNLLPLHLQKVLL